MELVTICLWGGFSGCLISVLVDHLAGYLIQVKAHILVHHCTSYRKFNSS